MIGQPPTGLYSTFWVSTVRHLGTACGIGSFGLPVRFLFHFLQLGEQSAGTLFDRPLCLPKNGMIACRHRSHFGGGRGGLRGGSLRKRANAGENLRCAKPALSGKVLPMSALEIIAAVLAGDLLCEVLRDMFPYLPAHHIVERRERYPACFDHDGIVLCVRVSVTCDDVEDDHIEQPQYVFWQH